MSTEPTAPRVREDGALAVDFAPPPTRSALPATPALRLDGRRVVVQTPAEWLWDLRAVSEVYRLGDALVVDVVREAAWYLHRYMQRPMNPQSYPARHVYLERPTESEMAAAARDGSDR